MLFLSLKEIRNTVKLISANSHPYIVPVLFDAEGLSGSDHGLGVFGSQGQSLFMGNLKKIAKLRICKF